MPVVLSAIASCALNVAHSGHQTAPYQTTGTRSVSLTGDAAAAEARRRVAEKRASCMVWLGKGGGHTGRARWGGGVRAVCGGVCEWGLRE